MIVQKQSGHFYGWINAALLFVIYFCTTGMVGYGFAAIFPAMIEALKWGRGEASIAATINALAMGFLMPVMALSINRFGLKKTIITGLIVLTVALFLLGTVTNQLWMWNLLWGIIIPFGFALGGLFPIQTILMYWFSGKRAMVLGLVMTGAPLAGFIAQPLFTWLILKTGTWQIGWLFGGGFVVLALILMFFIVNKPEDLEQHPDGRNPSESGYLTNSPVKAAKTFHTSRAWTFREIIKTQSFWLITMLSVVHAMPIIMMTTHGVLHCTDMGYSRMQGASVLSAFFLGSSVARFPMGWLGDRIEPRWISTAAYAIMAVAYLFIWQAPNLLVLIVMGFVSGLTIGTILVMMPTLFGNYFGVENYANIMGLVIPITIILGALVPTGAGYAQERLGSYDLAFMVIIIALLIGIVSAALARPSQRP